MEVGEVDSFVPIRHETLKSFSEVPCELVKELNNTYFKEHFGANHILRQWFLPRAENSKWHCSNSNKHTLHRLSLNLEDNILHIMQCRGEILASHSHLPVHDLYGREGS